MLPSSTDLNAIAALVGATQEAMDVESVRRPLDSESTVGLVRRSKVSVEIKGRLRVPSDRAYEIVSAKFQALGHFPLFRRSPDGDVILAVAGALPRQGGWSTTAIILFVATLISVLWMGAMNEQLPGQDLNLLDGIPFAASLLSILVAHEMGHYLMARRLGVPASLPYFIPMPLSIFGTMGAVMQMKAPPRDKRALLAVGAAGPVAGLLVGIPVLLIGLSLSQVHAIPAGEPIIQEGNSLLYAGLKILVFGRFLPAGGQDVFLHPIAWAGWAGLLVTALNLIPASQLDGGHIMYALIGERARLITWGVVVALVALSFLWWGWLLWAGLTFMFARVHAVPLDDITVLRSGDRAFALAMLVVAVLVFIPVPIVIN
ncbi:MAG: site-2 protease family protein [Chloroflexota bacterium]